MLDYFIYITCNNKNKKQEYIFDSSTQATAADFWKKRNFIESVTKYVFKLKLIKN